MLSSRILLNKTPYDLLSIIELIKTIFEECRLLEVLHVRLSTLQFVELFSQGLEDAAYTCMVRKHHATHFVLRGHVWALLGQGNLD